MAKKRGRFWRIAERGQEKWDDAKLDLKRNITGFDPLLLQLYRSHGRPGCLHLMGRLIEEKGADDPEEDSGLIGNILNTIRRFESDEIPDARIVARYGETAVAETRTDHEGFFRLALETEEALDPGWNQVEVEVMDSLAGGAGLKSMAEVLVPSPEAEYGIISDIDDTVLESQATDLLTQLRLTFSRSARDRSPMPGATPLYRMLEGGPDRQGYNPFFYVSNTGWGLYDLVKAFLDEHGLPKGPIYLQDIAIMEPKSPHVGSENHKHETIGELFEVYPELKFVLIGDSGQEDPENYLDLVKAHGEDRIRAVLIRAVTPPERDSEVREIIQEIADAGIPAAAAESSVSLARAAADFDLIPHDAIAEVREAMVAEEKKV